MRPLLPLAVVAALVLVGVASGATAPPTATVTASFAGLTDAESGALEPPDIGLAVGPGFVVQMVNAAVRIWRTGAGAPTPMKTQQLPDFFGTGSLDITDPRVEYDVQSGRWYATISTEDADTVILAVSKTSDPTGAWSMFPFTAPGCADQPRLGMADGVVVIAADVFSSCGSTGPQPLGSELWIVNKNQLVLGISPPSSTTYGPNFNYASLAPAQSLSPTSTAYVVSVDNPSSGVVHQLNVTGIPPAAVQVQEVAAIPITPLQPPPDAQEPQSASGRSQSFITNDDRILDSVWENGRLWFSADDGCTPSGDSFVRSCARVAQITTGTHTLDWDFDLGDAGAYTYFPAIRPDGVGNLAVVYGETSPTMNPQLRAVVRAPDGTFSTPVVVASSQGPHIGSRQRRFGDYFGAARDALDPSTVWFAGEIGSTVAGGAPGWNTAIGSVQITGGGGLKPVVEVATPPRLKALASSGRSGTTLRLRYQALDAGKVVREQVTVTNPLGGGVFSATTAKNSLTKGTVYAFAWRAHRAGRFKFCVRSIDASGAKSAQTCAIATVNR